jgi:hypothetical protein
VGHTYNLATQEAEISRMEVWSQPGQMVHKTLSQKTHNKKRAGGVAQGVGPEFKHQYHTKKKKMETRIVWNVLVWIMYSSVWKLDIVVFVIQLCTPMNIFLLSIHKVAIPHSVDDWVTWPMWPDLMASMS